MTSDPLSPAVVPLISYSCHLTKMPKIIPVGYNMPEALFFFITVICIGSQESGLPWLPRVCIANIIPALKYVTTTSCSTHFHFTIHTCSYDLLRELRSAGIRIVK